MAQAPAFAIGSSNAFQQVAASVVQRPLRPFYRNCTSHSPSDLASATISSLYPELVRRGGVNLDQDIETALRELVNVMVAMAEGTASPHFFLSSLDPGVGKTTTLIYFVQQLLRSTQHEDAGVLLCFSRLEEIVRLVEEMDLDEADFAVMTSDDETNLLSSTPSSEARVLFTTQAMIMSRCRGGRFRDVGVFHYLGEVRVVRIWDEAMLPGDVVSLSTDQLASLREPLRQVHPPLAELVVALERELEASGGQGTFNWPNVDEATGISYLASQRGLEQRHACYLNDLYALSGRHVLVRRPHNARTVITALDSRDALPDDFASAVILDASGRVRSAYKQWEKTTGNLNRLPSATRSYRNLTVHVMDKGSGKTSWMQNGNDLAREVAQMIDSKPTEDWLVVYHKGVNSGSIPDQIMGLVSANPDRVSFLNWGKHQGTNEFRHIRNVILTGLNNHPETDYEMKARYYSDISTDQQVPETLIQDIEAGEQKHHILQALCRSAVRQGKGTDCSHCNAYIIAPKRSGVRDFLPEVFPGCTVSTWKPAKVKLTGWVADAVAKVKAFFSSNPDGVYLYRDLRDDLQRPAFNLIHSVSPMSREREARQGIGDSSLRRGALGVTDASNFNRRVRRHDSYKRELDRLGLEEIATGKHRYHNALAMKSSPFGPIEGSTYIADI